MPCLRAIFTNSFYKRRKHAFCVLQLVTQAEIDGEK